MQITHLVSLSIDSSVPFLLVNRHWHCQLLSVLHLYRHLLTVSSRSGFWQQFLMTATRAFADGSLFSPCPSASPSFSLTSLPALLPAFSYLCFPRLTLFLSSLRLCFCSHSALLSVFSFTLPASPYSSPVISLPYARPLRALMFLLPYLLSFPF